MAVGGKFWNPINFTREEMNYTSHAYRSRDDLYDIGRLIRRAYSSDKYFNAWSFCRFDIWAQRRIADAEAFHAPEWQEGFRCWRAENGSLVAAAFAHDNHRLRKNPEQYALILDPDHRQLADEILDWAETNIAPEIEVLQSNQTLLPLVQSRGYTCSNDFMVIREKELTDTSWEPVNVAQGYSITVLDESEWQDYFCAVHEVFNMMDTVEAFSSIRRAPSNVDELHLDVINEKNEIAAFCSVWLDRDNNVAEFEPVGTVPQFQKKGLGSALLAHACNRLPEMGCRRLKVESWSESAGANKLYDACGLIEKDRLYSWKKIDPS
jgi:GNAT superfamily N-acetyltransferase